MKRIIAFLLAGLLLFLCGCEMRGNTVELDLNSPDALLRTYTAILKQEIEMTYTNTETLPEFRAQILNHAGKTARIINIYLYNESTYNMTVHGYMWFVNGETHTKGIYYNAEKRLQTPHTRSTSIPARTGTFCMSCSTANRSVSRKTP